MVNFLYFLFPSCWTCRHHLRHKEFPDLNKCSLNKRRDNTTGFTEEARLDKRKCGPNASWYVAIDDPRKGDFYW